MGMSLVSVRLAAALALIASAPLGLVPAARAGDGALPVPGNVSGLIIHDAAETLRDYCVSEDGLLWLELPNGSRHELVTSVKDPAIVNPGDGSFHPFDELQVRGAIAALRQPLGTVHAEVFL